MKGEEFMKARASSKTSLAPYFFQLLFHLHKAIIFGQGAFHFCTSASLPLSFQTTKGSL
jgi:hypothetical protein